MLLEVDMPSLPGDGFQLVALLLFVLPGIVYQFVRTRLRGPVPDDASSLTRVLRALGMSVFLVSLYTLLAGPWLLQTLADAQAAAAAGRVENVRQLGGAAVALLFGVPAAVALLDHVRRSWGRRGTGGRREKMKNIVQVFYDPTYPTAWEAAFDQRSLCFVRVLTKEGTWVGGWYGEQSWSTSYPEPKEIYLQAAYLMDADGTFGAITERSAGIYVRCEDARLVEFVDAPAPPSPPPGAGPAAAGSAPAS